MSRMNKFKILFYSLSIITAGVLILYGLNVFPVPGTDSIVFIPPALLFSKGYGLTNPLYYVTRFTDLTHTNRFNYYVPFYSLLLGFLGKINPGIKTIFLFCALFSTANLLLYMRVITSFLKEKIRPWPQILLLLSVTYIATYLLPTVGRPENLTSLLVFLVYILYRKRENYRPLVYNLFVIILFSLILATQLICFYFCFLFFVTYELLNTKNVPRTIGVNAVRFLVVLAGFCIVLSLSPNGLVNTINGISIHVSYVFGRSDRSLSLFIHYWLLAPLNLGFVFIFILSTIYYIKELYTRLKSVPLLNSVLIVLTQAMVLLGFIQFILYGAPTVYNATEFILPITTYLVLNILFAAKTGTNRCLFITTLITYVAGSLLFLRSIILFIDYKNDGKDYDHAKTLVSSLTKNYPGMFVTNSLWSLYDNPNDARIFNDLDFKKGDVIIIQQVNHRFPQALVNKCTTIYDWRTAETNEFLGMKLANRPQGYGFMVCKVN